MRTLVLLKVLMHQQLTISLLLSCGFDHLSRNTSWGGTQSYGAQFNEKAEILNAVWPFVSTNERFSYILLKVKGSDTALQIQYGSTKEANEKSFEQLNRKSDTFHLKCAQPNVVLMLRLTYSCILVLLGTESVRKNQSP